MKKTTSLIIIATVLITLLSCAKQTVKTTHSSISSPVPTVRNQPESIEQGLIVPVPMMMHRAAHTATMLPNGSVLLAGGFANEGGSLDSVEIYYPFTRQFVSITDMHSPRQSHTATLLPNGQVLIAGGYDGNYLATTEIFDPATNRFSPAGTMTTGRSGHIAVSLDDGTILLAGGTGEGWSFLDSAEIYDPNRGTFTPVGNMISERESHTATLLENGRVLITGGHRGRRADIVIYDSAEIYNPVTQSFASVANMTIRRHKHDATLLADGRVLISGGADERDSNGVYHSAEIFDPQSSHFSPAGKMNSGRYKHYGTSILLKDGRVLLAGGAPEIEVYDPVTNHFQLLSTAGQTRLFATATLLANDIVLLAGGYGPSTIETTSQAWLLTPN